MNIPNLQNAFPAASIPIDRLEQSAQLSETDKVREASRQFEAVLLRQILTAARKTVIQSEHNPTSATSQIYEDMITNQLAEGISKAGTFGLARGLEVQLRHEATRPSGTWEGLAPALSDPKNPSQSNHPNDLRSSTSDHASPRR